MSQGKKHVPNGHVYLIALGGNLPSQVGSPRETLTRAMQSLREYKLVVKEMSRFFQTPAFPAGNGPDYVNAAAIIEPVGPWPADPADGCQKMLEALHAVEHAFGRTRDTRWGQRTLDLDLIAAGDVVLPDRATHHAWVELPSDQQTLRAPEELIVPHPRMQDRAFVLVPLGDIAADWVHPVTGLTVAGMIAGLHANDVESVVALTQRGPSESGLPI